jgi:DNA polymerase III alpha subunit
MIGERERGGAFTSLGDFVTRVPGLRPQALEALAMGGAFECFGLNQRDSLWGVLAYQNFVASRAEIAERGEQLCFFRAAEPVAAPALFAPLSESQAIEADYRSYGLSVRGHPMAALRRSRSARDDIPRITSQGVKNLPNGRITRIAGLVIARQRPPTAKGTAFATLEDEDGFLDLILHREVFERFHEVFVHHAFLRVTGKVQADGHAVNLSVRKVEALAVPELHFKAHDFH